MAGNTGTQTTPTYTKVTDNIQLDWKGKANVSTASLAAFKAVVESSIDKDGKFNQDTFNTKWAALNDYIKEYQTILKDSGYETSNADGTKAFQISENGQKRLKKLQADYWGLAGIAFNEDGTIKTGLEYLVDDASGYGKYTKANDGTYTGGDGIFGKATYAKALNYMTDTQKGQFEEFLKEKGLDKTISLIEQTGHDLNVGDSRKVDGDSTGKYYMLKVKGTDPETPGNTPPGEKPGGGGSGTDDEDPTNMTETHDGPEITIDRKPGKTRINKFRGIDLTPLEAMRTAMNAYNVTNGIMRANMSVHSPEQQGIRGYTAVKNGFTQQQVAGQQAADLRNQYQRQAHNVSDINQAIAIMSEAEQKARTGITDPAAAQSEAIYNQSLQNQEALNNKYDQYNLNVSSVNANTRYINQLQDANARVGALTANGSTWEGFDHKVSQNAALVKSALTEDYNGKIQTAATLKYSDIQKVASDLYSKEYVAANGDAIKEQAALDKYNKTMDAAKKNYYADIQDQMIYGHESYYMGTPSYMGGHDSSSESGSGFSSGVAFSDVPAKKKKTATKRLGGRLINKMQVGGFVGTYFPGIPTMPKPAAAAAMPSSVDVDDDDEKKKTGNLISDSVLKDIQSKALPTDYGEILSSMRSMQTAIANGLPGGASQIYSLSAKINRAFYNADRYDDASKQMLENKSLDEVALTNTGRMYAFNEEGDLTTISCQEFQDQIDDPKYQVVTNKQLLDYRASSGDPNMAFQDGIFSAVQNSVGEEVINKELMELVDKMGDSELTETDYTTLYQHFGEKISENLPTQAQAAALQQLKAVSQDSLVSVKSTMKNLDPELFKQHLEQSAAYMWKVLPDATKNSILARAAVQGQDISDPSAVIQSYIMSAIFHGKDTSMSQTAKIQKGAAGSGSSGTSGLVSISPTAALLEGSMGRGDVDINYGPQGKLMFKLPGNEMTDLSRADGKPVERGKAFKDSLLSQEGKTQMSNIFDTQHIYIGEKKVDYHTAERIVGANQAKYRKVWVPVTGSGDIDFEAFKQLSDVQQELQETNEYKNGDELSRATQFNSHCTNKQLPFRMDQSGQIKFLNGKVEPYFMTYGIMEDDDVAENNDLCWKAEGWWGDQETERYHDQLDAAGIDWSMWSRTNSLYQFPVFIKIDDSAAHTVMANDSRIYTQKQTVGDIALHQAASAAPTMQIYGSSAALYAEDDE